MLLKYSFLKVWQQPLPVLGHPSRGLGVRARPAEAVEFPATKTEEQQVVSRKKSLLRNFTKLLVSI